MEEGNFFNLKVIDVSFFFELKNIFLDLVYIVN